MASDISQFVFTTDPQVIKPNEASEKITVQAQDADGNLVKITETIYLELKTNSSTGEFSASSTKWVSTSKLTMAKNTANRSFYYKDSAVGNYKLTIKANQWTAEQDIVVSESALTPELKSESPKPTYDDGSIEWPVEPQIFANAGSDKTAIAGADVYFSGKALGLKKEPLESARYLWNFGDGAISEGQNVKHVYKYPGEYIVILDISSGKYSASGRLTAKIIPNQLEIIEANQNYIKLHNGSNVELDISHWFLKAENIFFKFPANTFIKTNRDLMIDSSVSGLKAESQKAEILYPNGSIAFSFFGYAIAKPVSVVNFEPEEIVNVGNRVSDISGAVAGVESSASNTDSQVANVVSVVKGNDGDIKNWLLAILGIGAISGAGLILVRRQGLL
ncbi:PKD domain-containing protein [Patescibacteria group bacterium]|nr:PKD domain-containing protein [Patescibacteria group bacterium]